jgi:bifunctional non-homologous end joining protein LigD
LIRAMSASIRDGGLNWADRMPSIARALGGLKVRSAVIDGEAIVISEDGLSDFFALHAALARKSAPRAVLVALTSCTSTVRIT